MKSTELSKIVSQALRHEPSTYGIHLDEAGWVELDELVEGLHRTVPDCAGIGRDDVIAMVASAEKPRHELAGGKIRASYGHSIPSKIVRQSADPPPELFHGTSPEAWRAIQMDGIRPMKRQFVHLSPDTASATLVARRHTSHPVILVVDTVRARAEGTQFFPTTPKVWLADYVPASAISEF